MLDKFQEKKLTVGGSSAGTDILQVTPMITGGESYPALVYGSYDYIDDRYPDNLTYDGAGGFGFFRYGLLDTHVGTRGRQGRMIRLMADLRGWDITKGVGIDENTALLVVDNMGEIIGESGVYFFDSAASEISNKNGLFKMNNIKVSYLTYMD